MILPTNKGLSLEQRRLIADWAATKPLIAKIYLYGSRARETHQPDSDVDLAIVTVGKDAGEAWGHFAFEKAGWKEELQQLLHEAVQLETPDFRLDRKVGPGVLKDGQLLYSKGSNTR
ncbi:MAG: nucleotidyltransferase family protein [Sphingomicrobium sp.]